MSLKALGWAFGQLAAADLTDGEKVMLLALADHANDDGECFPSVSRLGQIIGRGDRTVRDRIAALEDKALLVRVQRRRENGSLSTNAYRLALPPHDYDPPTREDRQWFIYAIQGGERIKIGISADPEARLAQLQSSASVELRLIAKRPGTREEEQRLHGELATHREYGEWFRDVPAVREALSRTVGTHPAVGNTGAGPELPVAVVDQQQIELPGGGKEDGFPPLRRKVSVGRHRVTNEEWRLAAQILNAFNEVAQKRLGHLTSRGDPSPHMRQIIERIREHPDLDLAAHRAILERNFANPWWSGDPGGVGVIYGPRAFTRCVANKGRPEGKRRFQDERLDADDEVKW